MTLETATYSAYHGYNWSRLPKCLSERQLNLFYRMISQTRGDFPSPLSVEIGLVSDGTIAAAFTIQNVENWDDRKRSSEYAALAFFPVAEADNIDFVDLINHDFFWTPTRKPKATLEYEGGVSQPASASAIRGLSSRYECTIRDPRTLGNLLSQCGNRSNRWIGLLQSENSFRIVCNRWI